MKPQPTDRRWMPSNGTEGHAFLESWCGECARDKHMSTGTPIDECSDAERCTIIADSFVEDDMPEWVLDSSGRPMCTAFVPVGEQVPPERDDRTLDMFAELEKGNG